MNVVDHSEENEAWEKCLHLLTQEVLPHLEDLTGD